MCFTQNCYKKANVILFIADIKNIIIFAAIRENPEYT